MTGPDHRANGSSDSRERPDGSTPAHREGEASAAAAALAIDVDVDGVEIPTTDPTDLQAALRGGDPVTILDIRGKEEVAAWRIEGPTVEYANVPAALVVEAYRDDDRLRELVDRLSGRPVVVVCPRGRASVKVAAVLREAGVEATTLDGGMRGWASVYVANEVDLGDSRDGLAVVQYDRPSSGCLSYLVHDGSEGVVVDPLRAAVDRYREDAAERGVEIVAVLDTHVHADHVSGLRELASAAGADAVVPARALDRGLAYADGVRTVAGGDRMTVGDTDIEVLALPGHTTEAVGLRTTEAVLCGDTLFLQSVARPDLEAGEDGAPDLARQLHRTLHETVLALPADLRLAPGHHGPGAEPAPDGTYTARLETVRDRLGVLDLDEDAFVERLVADIPPRPANYREILDVNLGRTAVGDERAFTLELGPNNCAATPDGDADASSESANAD